MKETVLVCFLSGLAGASPALFLGGSATLSHLKPMLPEHRPVPTTVEGEQCLRVHGQERRKRGQERK